MDDTFLYDSHKCKQLEVNGRVVRTLHYNHRGQTVICSIQSLSNSLRVPVCPSFTYLTVDFDLERKTLRNYITTLHNNVRVL